MAETIKILGQAAPAAAVLGDIYTVPAGKSAVVSSLVLCNTSATSTTVSVSARIAGAANAVGNRIIHGIPIAAYETITLSLGITLGATDVLSVNSAAGGVTATAFGSETDDTKVKILGQAVPAAGADTAILTVGAGKSAVVSSLVLCNTGAATTVRVQARIAGAAVAFGNMLVYEMPLAANETVALTLGITLAATDVLSGRSASGGVTFTAFGTEVS